MHIFCSYRSLGFLSHFCIQQQCVFFYRKFRVFCVLFFFLSFSHFGKLPSIRVLLSWFPKFLLDCFSHISFARDLQICGSYVCDFEKWFYCCLSANFLPADLKIFQQFWEFFSRAEIASILWPLIVRANFIIIYFVRFCVHFYCSPLIIARNLLFEEFFFFYSNRDEFFRC